MANFRKYPDRVLVDRDGTDLASTASNALAIEVKTPDGGSAMDDTADAVKVLQVNATGAAIALGQPTFSVLTASTAAVAFATNPSGLYRLLRVEAEMSSAATAAEDFTVTIDAGDGGAYDSLVFSVAASTLSDPNVVQTFGEGYEYEADDDIDVAFTNSEANTVSVRVVYELL